MEVLIANVFVNVTRNEKVMKTLITYEITNKRKRAINCKYQELVFHIKRSTYQLLNTDKEDNDLQTPDSGKSFLQYLCNRLHSYPEIA